VSYGYFDLLSTSKSSTIKIGYWLFNPEDIKEYVENKYEDEPEIGEYILDIIGTVDGDEFIPDITFEDYTVEELIEIVELIDEFKDSFLEQDQYGNYKFPTNNKPDLQNISGVESFLPGDVQFIKNTFLLANYANNSKNTPVTFQVAIDLPGVDLSDFYVEVLLDNTPLSKTSPFAFDSRVQDTAYNNSISGAKQNQNNPNLVDIGSRTITYTTLNNYSSKRYLHSYTNPTFIKGNWTRFIYGVNLAIANNVRLTSSGNYTEGMKLIGSPTGEKTILTFSIRHRTIDPNYGSLPIIPVTIVVSRGKLVDANGNELTQSMEPVTPNISYRVVDGDAYSN
jgi:hypothetical protein